MTDDGHEASGARVLQLKTNPEPFAATVGYGVREGFAVLSVKVLARVSEDS